MVADQSNMERKDLIAEVQKYFQLKELVCPHVLDKYNAFAWNFLRTDLLETLLTIRRDIIQAPMVVNNGTWKQRGLRCNRCDLVKTKTTPYLSAHVLGAGIDFDAKGYTAEQARAIITKHANLLPHPIRMEAGVNWVHIDLYNDTDKPVITFKA